MTKLAIFDEYFNWLTRLSNSDNVMPLKDGGDRELLDRSWVVVTAKFNILQHGGMNAGILEAANRINLGRALLLDLDAGNSVKWLALVRNHRVKQLTEKSQPPYDHSGSKDLRKAQVQAQDTWDRLRHTHPSSHRYGRCSPKSGHHR